MKRTLPFLPAFLVSLAIVLAPALVRGDEFLVPESPATQVVVEDVPGEEVTDVATTEPAADTAAAEGESPAASVNDEQVATDAESVPAEDTEANPEEAVLEEQTLSTVTYRSHAQTYGWLNWQTDGALSGTTGEAKRVEAIQIKVNNNGVSGSIQYRVHAQSYGWMGWQKDGAVAGTTGEAKRVEAIQIKVTGALASRYDVVYRVHVQGIGWMDWVENGATAGTTGQSRRIEAIEIKLVAKSPSVSYNLHVQGIGWQGWKKDGALAGTTEQAKRVEALQIKVDTSDIDGGITYRAYVEGSGWQGWKSDGATAGTTGQSKRVEAVQIKLTGAMAEEYDVYYRVYVQKIGWMGWAKNGASAGNTGLNLRVEAIQIKIVRKGKAAPSSSDCVLSQAFISDAVSYRMADTYGSWYGWQKNGATAGKEDGTRSDLLQVKISGAATSAVQVEGHVQGIGWTNAVGNGQTIGTAGRRLEGVRISLAGPLANACDIWYRTYVRGMGWLGWATNGQNAGTQGMARSICGIQVMIVPKGAAAPGTTIQHFKQPTRIYIDAGHGIGSSTAGVLDPGASGNGYQEYQLTMELAKLVAGYLESEYGMKIYIDSKDAPTYTARQADADNIDVYVNTECNVHYTKRQAQAEELGCTCFLSIHFNAFSDPAATGSETFIHSQHAAPGAEEFREYIHPRLIEATGLRDRGRLSERFAVCGGNVPATLCEVCFITNPGDMRAYQKNKDKVARALAEGLYEASKNGF